MTCYHPYKAFIVGVNPDTGKKELKIKKYEVKYLYKKYEQKNDVWLSGYDEICPDKAACDKSYCDSICLSEKFTREQIMENSFSAKELDEMQDFVYEFIPIPCGKCAGCNLDRSRDWAVRMILELETSENAWFLTLTYDDLHVPRSDEVFYRVNEETGEIEERQPYSLRKDDTVKFMKDLRNRYGAGIRFYAAGEYGERTFRPHYHLIIYNLPISLKDLDIYKRDKNGYPLYTCETIEKIWSKGHVLVAPVNFATCSYCARYVTKKVGPSEPWKYEYYGIEPEFQNMSRNPGIGRVYYDLHKEDLYRTYIIVIGDKYGAYKFRLPKYYDYLYEQENPEKIKELKEQAVRVARSINESKMSKTDKDFLEYLRTEEEKLLEGKQIRKRDKL